MNCEYFKRQAGRFFPPMTTNTCDRFVFALFANLTTKNTP
jgi:hypothetical protein